MAKKEIAPTTDSPAVGAYTPTIYVDLTKSDIGEMKGIQVGDKIKVTITGKVKSLSMREDNKEKTGSLQLESKDVAIKNLKAEGAFEKLLEEDDG